jgi:hypothetical protein
LHNGNISRGYWGSQFALRALSWEYCCKSDKRTDVA